MSKACTTSLSQINQFRTTCFLKCLFPESINPEWIIPSPLSLGPGIEPSGVEFEPMAKSGLMHSGKLMLSGLL